MGVEHPYVLHGLSEEKSWTLFEKVAFREHERKVNSKLKVIGKEIVKRCKGVPLAIRSLASVLQLKTKESEWLLNSDIWRDDDILPILKLSYDHLPSYLKQCFAYCAIFPKDHEIKKEFLVQLWMAQGYVQSPDASQHLEEIGNQYFGDLLSRSFFQDARVDDGDLISCKMHDLIHDLAMRVAGFDCCIVHGNANNISERVRHVSISLYAKVPTQLMKAKGLRTLLRGDSLDILSKLTYLRVLDVHSCGVCEVPSSIGKLQHLRYLDLSNNHEMTSLPNSIRKLVNLQTLKLSDCYQLKKLPEGITKLINLRYLVIDGCLDLDYMPSGMGKLTSLRRLNKFVVGGNKWGLRLNELNELNQVRGDISIECLENVKDGISEAKEANLMARQYLHSLTLKWGGEFDRDMDEILLEGLQPHPILRELSIERYPGQMFPSWMRTGNIVISLPNIVRITLDHCDRCKHLPQSLDQLPFLKSLTLRGLERVEHISNNERMVERKSSSSTEGEGEGEGEGMSVFFPSLEKLVITNLPNLKGWWRAAGTSMMAEEEEEEEEREESSVQRPSFPRLTTLKIFECPKLTSMPIHSSNHLEELEVGGSVPEKLVRQLLLTTSATTTSSSITITEGGSASSSSSSSISSLSKLKSLSIALMESLPEEEVLWKNLSSLDRLEIGYIQKLVSLPVGLQQLTTLQHLEIYGCDGLMALPDWLSNLTSLQELYIYDCPLLSERCQKETGQDWSKISHIPYIGIDYKTIQRRRG